MKHHDRKKQLLAEVKPELTKLGLTPTQENFAQWYVALNANGTQAALKAFNTTDYQTARALSVEYLQKPHVKERVLELWRREQEAINQIPSKERIVNQLCKLAYESENEAIQAKALDTLARIEKLYSELELKADNVTFNVQLSDSNTTLSKKQGTYNHHTATKALLSDTNIVETKKVS